MTNQRDLKLIIRARMADTGESYTVARAQVLRDQEKLTGRPPRSRTRRLITAGSPSRSEQPRGNAVRIVSDARHELICIVARLAGLVPCIDFKRTAYAAQVDRDFAPYKKHQAITHLEKLCRTRGFEYWFFLQFVVKLSNTDTLATRLPYPAPFWAPEAQWSLAELEELRIYLQDFARDSSASRFLHDHAGLYGEALQRLNAEVDGAQLGAWIHRFHRQHDNLQIAVSPSMLTRSQHYIAENEFPDGRRECYGFAESSLGTDERGIPIYKPTLELDLVELFCRLRVNAEVSVYETLLRAATVAPFAKVQPDVRRYPNYINSILSRAIRHALVGQYVRERDGTEAMERYVSELPFGGELAWVRPMVDLFEEFMNDGASYPLLGDFMPRVAEFFGNLAVPESVVVAPHRPDKSEQKGVTPPQVTKVSPPLGPDAVDPDTDVLRFEFDRPMNGKHWAIASMDDARFPVMSDDRGFDETGTVFTIPVRLEPETTYAFRFNTEQHESFADRQGLGLPPTPYRFHTGRSRVSELDKGET